MFGLGLNNSIQIMSWHWMWKMNESVKVSFANVWMIKNMFKNILKVKYEKSLWQLKPLSLAYVYQNGCLFSQHSNSDWFYKNPVPCWDLNPWPPWYQTNVVPIELTRLGFVTTHLNISTLYSKSCMHLIRNSNC